eukprot:6191538-Pleurochrysis_carterae.AAC.1
MRAWGCACDAWIFEHALEARTKRACERHADVRSHSACSHARDTCAHLHDACVRVRAQCARYVHVMGVWQMHVRARARGT